ncbi:MAG: succinylglutamate desuccinylase/aspartoacylase family protein [Chitinivibrionales bacterium]|nr:succinylglutamate desuccinylase/aspartoacylase family protein [Chitinivibrionales bacterium]
MIQLVKILLFIIVATVFTAFSTDRSAEYQKASDRLNAGKELYFSFFFHDRNELDRIIPLISIDYIDGSLVYAYANKDEFKAFHSLGIDFTIEQNPGDALTLTCSDYDSIRGVPDFNKWPTYDGYVNLMQSYGNNFPKLCRVFEIGKTTKGRTAYCLVLTGENKDPKPHIAQLGAIHGDEVIGTMVSFRMINQLLSGYLSGDSRATSILNSVELWYVPFCNLDGTYYAGNSNLQGAQRGNANGVDLNRTFPSLNHQGTAHQEPETKMLIDLLTKNQFTLAADFHGGINGYIYPWTFGASPVNADKAFFIEMGKHLSAKTVGGMKVGTAMEVVNYWATGTLVDYYNLAANAKGYTMEMGAKMISESSFDQNWNKYKEVYTTYYEYALTGICGTISDSTTGKGIGNVKVFVDNHDKNNSWVYSYPDGDYYRPIASGTYSLTFTHKDYVSKTIKDINVKDFAKTALSLKLLSNKTAMTASIIDRSRQIAMVTSAHSTSWVWDPNAMNIHYADLFSLDGQKIGHLLPQKTASSAAMITIYRRNDAVSGAYIVRFTANDGMTLTRKYLNACN